MYKYGLCAFLVHPAYFTEILKKVCEMLNSESTNILEEEEEDYAVLFVHFM